MDGVTNASPPLRTLPGGLALVVVRGRSMEPTLRDGDRLLVRACAGLRPDAVDAVPVGSLVVVRWPGDRPAAVKRLVRTEPDGGWWVERDNPQEGVDSWSLDAAVPPVGRIAVVVARLWPRPGRPARRSATR